MDEADIGTYTMKSVDDPKAENKLLYFQPKNNIFTQREAISLWERKMVTSFDKKEISEADFIQLIEGSSLTLFQLSSCKPTIVSHLLTVRGLLQTRPIL